MRHREPWADAAKGVLIVLVVLWHTTRKHYRHLPWVPDAADAAWIAGNVVLQPVRVPLFFLISGYLAARAMNRPWRTVLRTRVLRDYWLYLVWLVLGSAFFLVGPAMTTSTAHTWGELLLGAIVGYSNAWYLYALAAYVVVAKACVRLPLVVPVALGLLGAVLAELPAVPNHGNTESLLANLLPFLIGALAPRVVSVGIETVTWRRVLLATAVFLPLSASASAVGVHRTVGVTIVLAAAGTAFGLLLAVRGSRAFPGTAVALGRLGRRTLPIYVLHLPLLALLDAAVRPLDLPVGPGTTVLAAVYPVLAVAGLIAACLLLHRLLRTVGLDVLFRLPRWADAPGAPASLPTMNRTYA